MLGVDVVRPRVTETTALGAAYLAGMSVGVWSGPDDVAKHWHQQRRFTPHADAATRDRLLGRWHRAVDRAKGWEEAEAAEGTAIEAAVEVAQEAPTEALART
jgi:glycerol kinase